MLCITHLPQIAAYGRGHCENRKVGSARTHGHRSHARRRAGPGAGTGPDDRRCRHLGGGDGQREGNARHTFPRVKRGESEYKSKAKAKLVARKYLIETYGCQMNIHDSERMAGLLEQAGYESTADDLDADVIVINTCSVREKAEEKLFTRLGEIQHGAIESGSRPVVAVAGCVAQQEGSQILKRSTAVDVIIGTQNLKRLPMLVDAAVQRHASGPRAPTDPGSRSPRGRFVPARHRAPPGSAQGLRHHHRRLQRVLRLLRRPVHARQGADAAGGRDRRGCPPALSTAVRRRSSSWGRS